MDMRPEHELVVKNEGWRLIAFIKGTIGASRKPFGDLSGCDEEMEAKTSLFLCWNGSISYF